MVAALLAVTNSTSAFQLWLMFLGFAFLFVGAITCFDGVLLAHVLALLGPSVPLGTFLVVNMSLAVHPYHACSATGNWRADRLNIFRAFR